MKNDAQAILDIKQAEGDSLPDASPWLWAPVVLALAWLVGEMALYPAG